MEDFEEQIKQRLSPEARALAEKAEQVAREGGDPNDVTEEVQALTGQDRDLFHKYLQVKARSRRNEAARHQAEGEDMIYLYDLTQRASFPAEGVPIGDILELMEERGELSDNELRRVEEIVERMAVMEGMDR